MSFAALSITSRGVNSILMALWAVAGSVAARPDTLVLNQTEYRFPLTHPGKTFLVRKVVVNGELAKPVAQPQEKDSPSNADTPRSLVGRDFLGRSIREESYQNRMVLLRARHSLPTYGRSEIMSVSNAEKFVPPRQIPSDKIREESRFAIVSDSPMLQSATDLVRMEKAENEAVRRKYGALDVTLAEKLYGLGTDDSLNVLIQLKREHPGFINPYKATHDELVANGRAWANPQLAISPKDFRMRYGLKDATPEGMPARNSRVALARVSKTKIEHIARLPEVVSITEYLKPSINTSPVYTDLIQSAQNYSVNMVEHCCANAGTLEAGLGTAFVNRLPSHLKPVSYDVYSMSSYPGGNSPHSEGMYQLLADGAADNAEKFHYYDFFFENIQDSIFNYGILSLSSSWASFWPSPIAPDSRAVDRMAYTYPYPLVSLTAGQDAWDIPPDAQTYNSLIVGNVQHRDNNHYQVDIEYVACDPGCSMVSLPASQALNPTAVYGSVNDWELPTLVAPGFGPDPWYGVCFYDVWINSGADPWCPAGGTSLSAPVVAATASHVRAARGMPAFTNSITETKAILVLTAENVDGGEQHSTVDTRDGAGTISGANAVAFATHAVNTNNEIGPHISAMKSGYLDASHFQDGWFYIEENYRVPSSIPSGMHLRLVLTWTSSPGTNYAENKVSDLMLFAQSNGGWSYSDSWNGNVEVININNAHLNPNGSYAIRIYPTAFRTALDGPEEVHYTLAWTWVKDHAD